MSVINAVPLLAAAGGDYTISRSVRLRSSASAYFNRTPASASNRQTFTYSAWVKRGVLGSRGTIFDAYASSSGHVLEFQSDDTLEFYSWGVGATTLDVRTTQVFRDPSAWCHIVLAVDTTQATASNRVKLYVNGSLVTALNAASYPSQNASLYIDNNIVHDIGRRGDAQFYFDGYLTEVNFIDGQALTPSSFGETDTVTGVWKPKKYTGTYGTNGFYLNFSDNSNNTAATIGKDYSGNGNNWTPNNISVTSGTTYDSMLDVPTPYADGGNGRGNYSVLSPIDKYSSTIGTSEANLKLISTSGGSFQQLRNTIGMTSGKYYMEWVIVSLGAAGRTGAALIRHDSTLAGASTSTTTSWCYSSTGDAYANNVTTSLSTGAITTGTDVVMYAFDADTGKFWMGKNGTWANSGDPATGANPIYSGLTNGPYFFGGWNYNTSDVVAFNFGQRPFSYTPPSGFKALNTQNLPDSTIPNGRKYFDATTYTGNGVNNRAITGVGFQPDLVWTKARSAAYDALITDAVRGSGKSLTPSSTGAEVTNNGNGYVSAFNADGFTLTQGVSSIISVNESGQTYVGWQWKESATAGFDIVTYTGDGSSTRTVAHGLGVAPKMIIIKSRDGARVWAIAHDYGAFTWSSDYFQFDTGGKYTNAAGTIFRAAPTSSVFNLGTNAVVNQNTERYVAYLFAEVAGFSKFGSYTGNGSTDGPFVFCGFRPRWLLVKRTNTTGDWELWDTARDTYNAAGYALLPNSSQADSYYAAVDILSNGFKLRDGSLSWNNSGSTYIFAAFAENPFKNALAR